MLAVWEFTKSLVRLTIMQPRRLGSLEESQWHPSILYIYISRANIHREQREREKQTESQIKKEEEEEKVLLRPSAAVEGIIK